jgi:serine protease Do
MNLRISSRGLRVGAATAAGLAALLTLVFTAPAADELDKRLQEREEQRIKLIEQVKPAVIAVLSPGGQGGGSGVVISEDGYALTNFHVVAAIGSLAHVGMTTGEMYDAVVVGVDRSGDLGLLKIIPKKGKEDQKFPVAKIGDSDKLKVGDMTLALGNPQLLATDFNPTATFGMVSGLHRYQSIPHPTGALLEYCDSIQVDTAVNPGNSGGPLFNMAGEFVGINSAGSIGKSDRISSGVAYSISINMIKNFLGCLKAGMECDHASLGALIQPDSDEGSYGLLQVRRVLPFSDAFRRGLDVDDTLYRFGEYFDPDDASRVGFPMSNVNQYRNKLGIYPKGWRVPMVFKHNSERRAVLVRLMGLTPEELPNQDDAKPNPGAAPPPLPPPPAGSEAAKLFKAKRGFANYYFNELERDRVLTAFKKATGDFAGVQGDWSMAANASIGGKNVPITVGVRAPTGEIKNDRVIGEFGQGADFTLEPLGEKGAGADAKLTDPPGSGGLLLAMFQYRQLVAFGEKGLGGELSHAGLEPFYLPPPAKGAPDFAKQRVECEVLRSNLGHVPAKWYFSTKDGQLIGFELFLDHETSDDKDNDPCEVYLSNYQPVNGAKDGKLPNTIEVRYKEKTFAVVTVTNWKLEAAK